MSAVEFHGTRPCSRDPVGTARRAWPSPVAQSAGWRPRAVPVRHEASPSATQLRHQNRRRRPAKTASNRFTPQAGSSAEDAASAAGSSRSALVQVGRPSERSASGDRQNQPACPRRFASAAALIAPPRTRRRQMRSQGNHADQSSRSSPRIRPISLASAPEQSTNRSPPSGRRRRRRSAAMFPSPRARHRRARLRKRARRGYSRGAQVLRIRRVFDVEPVRKAGGQSVTHRPRECPETRGQPATEKLSAAADTSGRSLRQQVVVIGDAFEIRTDLAVRMQKAAAARPASQRVRWPA